MRFYEIFRHDKRTYGFTYLATDSTDLEVQRQVYRDLIDMLDCGQPSVLVKSKLYEGKIENKGPKSLGFLRGTQFDVTIDTERGRKNISLMMHT